MLKWLVRIITVLMLALSIRVVMEYWHYDEYAVDVAKLITQQVTPKELNRQVEEAIALGRPDDARMYVKLGQTFGVAVNAAQYEPHIQELEQPLNATKRAASEFVSGFLNGSAESGAGLAGSITSDFTVVGDVRDLWEQYQLYDQNKPTNELIVALAGVGVGLTAATVMSGGAASPAKAGVSTLKIATRAGRLTSAFQNFLVRQASSVFDSTKFLRSLKAEQNINGVKRAVTEAYNPAAINALSDVAERTNAIRQSSSLLDTVHLLQYVDNADDLMRLEKLTVKYGTETKGIMKFLGKSAIGTVRILRRSIELIVSLLSSFIAFLGMLLAWRR